MKLTFTTLSTAALLFAATPSESFSVTTSVNGRTCYAANRSAKRGKPLDMAGQNTDLLERITTEEETLAKSDMSGRRRQDGVRSRDFPEETETNQAIMKNFDAMDENEKPILEAIASKTQEGENSDFTRGLLTIGFITFLNASCNPLWHAAFSNGGPPPLLLNAAVSVTALIGLLAGGPFLESKTPSTSVLANVISGDENGLRNIFGGIELGMWKFLGTTAHIFGLSLTTADHGAFLIQLSTLIVPVIQGLKGEKIPKQIQLAIALALGGVYAFTQDPNSVVHGAAEVQQQQLGDALCVATALFYSAYDIQTFKWGKLVPRKQLVTTKIGTQAILSVGLLAATAWTETADYFASSPNLTGSLIPVVLWSGLIVNALATFLQVGGMQSVGPTRAQTIFASQPLWSSMLAFAFLGETIGIQGAAGGFAFLLALFLAATTPKEDAEPENG